MATFTEADRRKLEALKEKERKAKQEERNEAKRNDRICKKLFGMTAKEVKDKLEKDDYFHEYFQQKALITRLMEVVGKSYYDFEEYVKHREQAHDRETKSDTIL